MFKPTPAKRNAWALEEAAQFIERAQVRMKLPGNQAFCIYDANMAEEVRKLAEGL